MSWMFPQTTTGSGVAVTVADGDDVFVARDVYLSSTASRVIDALTGSGHELVIAGVLASDTAASVWVGTLPNTAQNSVVSVESTGEIRGFNNFALVLYGWNNSLSNRGLIYGSLGGVFVSGDHAGTETVLGNGGVISSKTIGIALNFQTEQVRFINSGTLSAPVAYGPYNPGDPSSNRDLITNTGRISGTIDLRGGNDSYSGASGRLTGKVLGGDGTDSITGGIDANEFQGGLGGDTLVGNAGNDTLKGDGGNDLLIGGLGKDALTGGANNDSFRFLAKTHSLLGSGADIITDFDDAGGNDRIDIGLLFGPPMTYRHNLAFTAAGQVRINDVAGVDVVVEVNTGGTLAADFAIRLQATTLASMTATDFVL